MLPPTRLIEPICSMKQYGSETRTLLNHRAKSLQVNGSLIVPTPTLQHRVREEAVRCDQDGADRHFFIHCLRYGTAFSLQKCRRSSSQLSLGTPLLLDRR